jgi:hypothetical protein
MAMIRCVVSAAAAALVFMANAEQALASNADTTAKAAVAAPTRDELLALEKSAYEAWKSQDARFWAAFLSDRFVGWSPSGRLDKASATKQYTGADCEIKSVELSNEQIQLLGHDVGLITHKTAVDGTCNGQTVPANSWVASVYVRDGNKWKGAFHAEAPIVDPKAATANPVDRGWTPTGIEAHSAGGDAGTDTLLATEKTVWEAWREHDSKRIGGLTARDISFINIFGTHLANKADALKDWAGTYCDVKSISITDAAGTMVSPTVGILTFKAAADGTCYGQKVGPVWGTSVYVKHGNAWKWTFGINLPAPQ